MTTTVTTELRKTGVDVVGDTPWGTHFCLFYDTTPALLDTLVPYCNAGWGAVSSACGSSLRRSIVESHGGRLWVTSNPGPGANFHLTLPIQPRTAHGVA